MAPGAGKWQRVPLSPQSRAEQSARPGPSGRHAADAAPLFSSLAREWRAKGRVVPGARDHEWDALVQRPVWPGRR
ncbi:hypothetical protein GCM10023237_28540 [Streptomyces coeruleoprunus]